MKHSRDYFIVAILIKFVRLSKLLKSCHRKKNDNQYLGTRKDLTLEGLLRPEGLAWDLVPRSLLITLKVTAN